MKLYIDRKSNTAPFQQIADQLKEGIYNGTYKENEALPSVREIHKQTGVSFTTIHRAFEQLKNNQLAYPASGRGYFVTRRDSLFSKTVSVFIPSSQLTAFVDVLSGIYKVAYAEGIQVQVHNYYWESKEFDEKTIDLLQKARDQHHGIIFVEEAFGRVLKKCREVATSNPFVAIEWLLDKAINIINDYEASTFHAMEYLYKKRQARSFLILTGRNVQFNSQEKIKGIKKAATQFKLVKGKTIFYLESQFFALHAYDIIKNFLIERNVDAIFCATDYEAMGAIGAVNEAGMLAGRDIAILGYGNVLDVVTSYFLLTTIDQHMFQMGVKAMEAILKKANCQPCDENIIVATTFREGKS